VFSFLLCCFSFSCLLLTQPILLNYRSSKKLNYFLNNVCYLQIRFFIRLKLSPCWN
jgi:hypothetical protein